MNCESAPFTVIAAKCGRAVEVLPGQSIAESLVAAGIEVAIGCLGGGCGTCVVQVLEGDAAHHDVFLNERERRQGLMTICVSRARGTHLVLDV